MENAKKQSECVLCAAKTILKHLTACKLPALPRPLATLTPATTMKFTTIAASLCVIGTASAFIAPVTVRSGESSLNSVKKKTHFAASPYIFRLVFCFGLVLSRRLYRRPWFMQHCSVTGLSLMQQWQRYSLQELPVIMWLLVFLHLASCGW